MFKKLRAKQAENRAREAALTRLPPLPPDRFQVNIVENIGLTGGTMMNGLKYRYTVVDTSTGMIQKVGYALTIMHAQGLGKSAVDKLREGKRGIKL